MERASKAEPSEATAEVLLRLVVGLYLVLGALYATLTPAWQVPDEPAHYNYVKYVAETRQLPVLLPGDFPQVYLEELKARRFPPDMPIAPIRYESYQPPLYYMLAAGVYQLTGLLGWPSLLILRAFSLVLGATALVVGYRVVRTLIPGSPTLALGTTAFAAMLPMHLAMTAAVNNDVLVELLVTLIAGRLVAMEADDWTARRAFGLGALLGIAFLVKIWAFVAAGMAFFALGWDLWRGARARGALSWGGAAKRAGLMCGTALLVLSPWLVRNATIYGPGDLLGMARHDQVVSGQLTTAQFIQQHGLPALLRDFSWTSFRSFWGQFGWMGVLLDERLYLGVAVVSTLALLGMVLCGIHLIRKWHAMSERQKKGLALMLVWCGLTVAGYLWYNTKYVQHQGRYLFFALVPFSLAFTVGVRETLHSGMKPVLVSSALGVLALLAVGLVGGDVRWFAIVLIVAACCAVALGKWLEDLRPGAALVVLYAGMAVLSVICLQFYIVPALRP
jgi:uncharacterized membrane protein